MNWFYNSLSLKSLGDLDCLVNNVILADDLQTFSVVCEVKWLDSAHSCAESPVFSSADGWHVMSIHITLNCKSKPMEEAAAPKFAVAANTFHAAPFKLFWQSDEDELLEHTITELYTLDAMLQEHENIKASCQESGCNLETIVATIMLWSDSTCLANFRNAALWPIYMFIGNQSKYTRPKLCSATTATLTHCKREAMQAVWRFLLDADFLHAYKHGLAIKIPDGIFQHVFQCIFTYAADYPEKGLLPCLKFLGHCPCPCCLVEKDRIYHLSSRSDQHQHSHGIRVDNQQQQNWIEIARQKIFNFGCSDISKAVTNLLGARSLVLTCTSSCSLDLIFTQCSMLVPDFMHKFELGVWKATLTHLL
ncbi:hypothetical protein PAXRUDRAFT_33599 [Paxillus rubicundulus Ve08.2h10]|uniref:Uncharacterized protein n=1 Tax=Paxillus rubicundulus Ve08.2h10 TaxID=930991 RepID=A0A0D0E1N8_9AGAM|nr:hypothetical protein PAXRUDRAFT_33599 [Paxillus rubicundulus Ve08.2h10]